MPLRRRPARALQLVPTDAIANIEAAIAEWGPMPSLVEEVERLRQLDPATPIDRPDAPPISQQQRRRALRDRRRDDQRHLGRRDNAAMRAALVAAGVRPNVCEACDADYLPCELDRRIPGDWEGEYTAANVHYLCLVCHRAKTKLERAIDGGYATAMHFERWLELAYPQPVFDALLYCEQWHAARLTEGVS